MKLADVAGMLDAEFDILNSAENLLDWAVTEDNRRFFSRDFLDGRTGLMTENSAEIDRVYTAVFVTPNIVDSVSCGSGCLLITHHNFDYHEDERGLVPISKVSLEKLKETGSSIYVAHAPLDTHRVYGTSRALAQLCGIEVERLFFNYFGAPVAVAGHIEACAFETFSENVRKCIQRPTVTTVRYHDRAEKIAVVAGGGDLPELLQEAYDLGCDTLLTGTVENRWNIPAVQEGNLRFHELNKSLALNLVGGTHYGTERPGVIKLAELLRGYGLECDYCEDVELLEAR